MQKYSQRHHDAYVLNGMRVGIRSGEVTPNSPSRPHSSMSQQSASSSVGSSSIVNLRSRTAVSRRPRPASIAGTGVTITERYSEHIYMIILTTFLIPLYPFQSSAGKIDRRTVIHTVIKIYCSRRDVTLRY